MVHNEIQEEILFYCTRHLSPGGVLLLKTVDRTPRWKFFWNLVQEFFAVKLFKFTRGSKFYFRTSHQWEELLESSGLRVEIHRLDKGYIHPHVLIIGRKI